MDNRGFTLIEVLVVVALIAILSGTFVSGSSYGTQAKLDAAAQDVADALRFARTQSITHKKFYGLKARVATQRIRLYWNDLSSGLTVVYDVINPIDKKLYERNFSNDAGWEGVTISSVDFWYARDSFSANYIDFHPDGAPVFINEADSDLLNFGEIRLSYAGEERIIRVSPITGRVSVL